MHGSQYMTNQSMRRSQYVAYSPTWERCWLQSSSVHHMMKITKLLGYKTLRCTNIATSWRDRWTRAYVSDSQYACEKLLHWVALVVMALKQSLYMFRVVRKESLNIYTHIGVKSNLKNWFFKSRQIPYLSSNCRASGWNSYLNLNRY